jgi:branched-chain amino acid transport system ATP-binding protein
MMAVVGGYKALWGPALGAVVYFLAKDIAGRLRHALDGHLRHRADHRHRVLARGHRRRADAAGAAFATSATGASDGARAPARPPRKGAAVSAPVLQAIDVAVHYGGVKAVDGVSFSLQGGQIRGLIGPNGAGKSTVIDAITGRSRLTRGKVLLDGEDVTALGVVQRRLRGLSRSFQRTSIFGGMTVRRQVELASQRMNAAGAAADAEAVLLELGLLPVAGAVADELGYGEQRRLDLALALVGKPKVLLLDEPMAGLSAHESQELARHLVSLPGAGRCRCCWSSTTWTWSSASPMR